MKAKVFLVIGLLIMLGGCGQEISKNSLIDQIEQKEESQVIKQGNNDSSTNSSNLTSNDLAFNEEALNNISYKIENLISDGINIKIIEPVLPKNCGIGFIDFYNDQLFLSIGYQKNDTSYIDVSILDITTGKSKEVYRGEGYNDNWNSNLRILHNGDLAFQTQEMIMIIDQDNMTIKKEIDLSSNDYNYSLSSDGTRIAFGRNHSLYVSDINLKEPKLLVKGKTLKGPDGEDHGGPGYPRWSNDDTKLSYILLTYEESEGFGIVNSNNSESMELKPEGFIPDFTYFYKNDEKLLCGQTIFEKLKIYSYDIKENTLEDVQVEQDWHTFMPNPNENIVAFSKGDYKNGQLFIYNLKTKKKEPISPIMEDASYLKWDSTGKMLVALLNRNKIAIVDNIILN